MIAQCLPSICCCWRALWPENGCACVSCPWRGWSPGVAAIWLTGEGMIQHREFLFITFLFSPALGGNQRLLQLRLCSWVVCSGCSLGLRMVLSEGKTAVDIRYAKIRGRRNLGLTSRCIPGLLGAENCLPCSWLQRGDGRVNLQGKSGQHHADHQDVRRI